MSAPVEPKIGDSSDKPIEMHKAKRLHGATVDEWIELIRKAPDRTLPGGVAGAIVARLDEVTANAVRLSMEVNQLLSTPPK